MAPNRPTGSISSRPRWGRFGMIEGSIREKGDATAANGRDGDAEEGDAVFSFPFCHLSCRLQQSIVYTTSYGAPV